MGCNQNMRITWLDPGDPFPPATQECCYPDGLLAAGADLSPARLLDAYQRGIFPWYNEGDPVLWWSPAPRCVIFPDQFHCSRSLHRRLRRGDVTVTTNRKFIDVMKACATTGTRAENGTWITKDMLDAYTEMHSLGWAHSVEVWRRDILVGGVYGLAIGKVFFGESMFSLETDTSKVALFFLCSALTKLDFQLLDCQIENPHLMTLGAQTISRDRFQSILAEHANPAIPLSCTDFQQAMDIIRI